MKEIKLSKPIRAHGEDVHVLELREPTGKDVRELGFPYTTTGDAGVKLDAGTVAKYVSRLSDINSRRDNSPVLPQQYPV
ncbi:TPA: phage tail assembly protein [Citrobacter amalonaticus]